MNEKLKVPKKLKVGFQNRSDTYSKKLAFVVYEKEDGKIAQEKSWKRWKDSKIPVEEYDNEPLSGFVLNRDVGGTQRSYGWHARREKVRVYDPRGFEIEITVDNLLFILQECSSIKGKGLEGEFVYAWSRNTIVLLPVHTEEYKKSIEYTGLQKQKVTKNDMEPGCTYLTKENENVMYLGRHNWYDFSYPRSYNGREYRYKKKHIFLNLDNKSSHRSYVLKTGFTHLAQKTSDRPVKSFADEYEALMRSPNTSPPSKVIFKKVSKETIKKRTAKNWWTDFWVKDETDGGQCKYVLMQSRDSDKTSCCPVKEAFFDGKKYKEVETDRYWDSYYRNRCDLNSFDEVGELYLKLENGVKKKM